jgi:5-methylcytosine-specific restriction endonuclease McrA
MKENNNIYRCTYCSRFLGIKAMSNLLKNGIEGHCTRCLNTRSLIWVSMNRKHTREMTKKWVENNRDKRKLNRKIYKMNYKMKKKNALDGKANNTNMKLIYKYAKELTKTTNTQYEVDHVTPIAKGGKHHENNLQVLTSKENNIKADKLNTNIIGPKLKEIKLYYNTLI